MKWCSYCAKADHDDSECWCTRAIPPNTVDPMRGMSMQQVVAPFKANQLTAAMLEAAARGRNGGGSSC